MLSLTRQLDKAKFTSIVLVVANTDSTSIESSTKAFPSASVIRMKRSREVGQSWISTVPSTCIAFLESIWSVYQHKPDLVLCNGPGTCVPICFSAFFLRVLGFHDSKILFVESFCRVDSLSLSGKILYHIVDRFIVQWPELSVLYRRAEYIGSII